QADILTWEEYYPYGGTAVWSARSDTEAKYKYVRYSGQERDATGLYYYGFRYYAPWLARWPNPDPAGPVDGLNLFCMVGNNPVGRKDVAGLASFGNLASAIQRGYQRWDPISGLRSAYQRTYQRLSPDRSHQYRYSPVYRDTVEPNIEQIPRSNRQGQPSPSHTLFEPGTYRLSRTLGLIARHPSEEAFNADIGRTTFTINNATLSGSREERFQQFENLNINENIKNWIKDLANQSIFPDVENALLEEFGGLYRGNSGRTEYSIRTFEGGGPYYNQIGMILDIEHTIKVAAFLKKDATVIESPSEALEYKLRFSIERYAPIDFPKVFLTRYTDRPLMTIRDISNQEMLSTNAQTNQPNSGAEQSFGQRASSTSSATLSNNFHNLLTMTFIYFYLRFLANRI
ncbi:RHS repeat-associated core domain-containing protein, partial [Burkholderia ubonensis]|uniref:RHS repeat-associated core domain-containing protein n=1 Tax=Burkholderia ubonensis TaxID=101571 RepID=UPI000B0B0A28